MAAPISLQASAGTTVVEVSTRPIRYCSSRESSRSWYMRHVAVHGLCLDTDLRPVACDVGRAAARGRHDMPLTAVMMVATLAAGSARSATRPRSLLSATISLLLPGSVSAGSEPVTTSSSACAAR